MNRKIYKKSGTFRAAAKALRRILVIGDLPQQSEEEKTQHQFLVYMGLLMSVGGIIWGSITFSHGLYLASLIPYGYTFLTICNFTYFYYSKNFRAARFNQVFISLLLPFLFQWSLGGFISSGAVMLWSLISIAGSLTFQDARSGIKWLFAFLGLTIFSGLIDARLQELPIEIAPQIITLFFVLNISIITSFVFILLVYLLARREEARTKLREMSSILKQMFGRYLSTEVMNSLIENPSEMELGGKRKKVTIMMTDLRGFTALSETLEPEEVVKLLNTYFEVMVDLILRYNGTINEFIGDSLLVIFGAPHEMEDRVERAVACAIEMQNAMTDVNEKNSSNKLPTLQMGIGLNETEVIVGNIGSSRRSKYAVVGSGVNLTSRIESYSVGGQILASKSVIDQVGDIVRIDTQRVVFPKGADSGLNVYEIGGISGTHNISLLRKTQNLLHLSQHIPLECTLVEKKQVGLKGIKGRIFRLSKHSAEISLDNSIDLFSNLQLKLIDVDEQLAVRGFYGKSIKCVSQEGNVYLVSFTSLPAEIAAYFQACRQYAVNHSPIQD
jgi:class 3 adenylate cyclase